MLEDNSENIAENLPEVETISNLESRTFDRIDWKIGPATITKNIITTSDRNNFLKEKPFNTIQKKVVRIIMLNNALRPDKNANINSIKNKHIPIFFCLLLPHIKYIKLNTITDPWINKANWIMMDCRAEDSKTTSLPAPDITIPNENK